jgi:Zn-dependent M28 family amino/carboxypeptidase
MTLSLKRIATGALAQLFLLTICLLANAQQSAIKISTPEEIKAEFSSLPCKNDERLAAVKALFEKAGAPASDISVEQYKNVENLVIRKQGTSADIIVVGAHYDKVPDGCGAVDNWTGIVAIAYLYKTLKDASPSKTVLFVAFGKEEKGLIGSRAMVDAIAKEQLGQYCAMINIDSLGLAPPQILDNASSKKLGELAENVAKEMKMPFSHAGVGGADADSSSFIRKKIPALTIHGLSNQWSSILHSRNDQLSKVNHISVYLGYRLALALLANLDASSCDKYR